MDNLNVLTSENNQVNVANPPPRVCPRCNSDKTKFCYYNNYTTSQLRYSCKNCRRYWTHGGALRNIPIGGSCRKVKRARVDQSVSPMVSAGIQQVIHQPFSYVQEKNEFVESIGASSSAAIGNHLGSLSEIHGSMVTNGSPIRSFQPNHHLDFHDGTFEQDYYDVGSESPFINQSSGGYVDNHNGYRINQVIQDKWNHSFNNTTNMNHNASTSGSRGFDINMNNESNNNRYKDSVIRHSCHLEKHGPRLLNVLPVFYL